MDHPKGYSPMTPVGIHFSFDINTNHIEHVQCVTLEIKPVDEKFAHLMGIPTKVKCAGLNNRFNLPVWETRLSGLSMTMPLSHIHLHDIYPSSIIFLILTKTSKLILLFSHHCHSLSNSIRRTISI